MDPVSCLFFLAAFLDAWHSVHGFVIERPRANADTGGLTRCREATHRRARPLAGRKAEFFLDDLWTLLRVASRGSPVKMIPSLQRPLPVNNGASPIPRWPARVRVSPRLFHR